MLTNLEQDGYLLSRRAASVVQWVFMLRLSERRFLGQHYRRAAARSEVKQAKRESAGSDAFDGGADQRCLGEITV